MGRRARRKIQQERKRNVQKRKMWEKDGKTVRYRDRHTCPTIHNKKELESTEILPRPEELVKVNYTAHGSWWPGL